MILYIVFSYLFLIGIRIEEEEMDGWNVLFAPITMPVILGKLATRMYYQK